LVVVVVGLAKGLVSIKPKTVEAGISKLVEPVEVHRINDEAVAEPGPRDLRMALSQIRPTPTPWTNRTRRKQTRLVWTNRWQPMWPRLLSMNDSAACNTGVGQ